MKHKCKGVLKEECEIERENGQWWLEKENYVDSYLFQINYCPFCGLNLNKVKK